MEPVDILLRVQREIQSDKVWYLPSLQVHEPKIYVPRYKLIKLSGVFDILAPILTFSGETETLVVMVMMVVHLTQLQCHYQPSNHTTNDGATLSLSQATDKVRSDPQSWLLKLN